MLTLKDLPIGKTATVKTVGGDGSLRQHLLDMGIIPEAVLPWLSMHQWATQ